MTLEQLCYCVIEEVIDIGSLYFCANIRYRSEFPPAAVQSLQSYRVSLQLFHSHTDSIYHPIISFWDVLAN